MPSHPTSSEFENKVVQRILGISILFLSVAIVLHLFVNNTQLYSGFLYLWSSVFLGVYAGLNNSVILKSKRSLWMLIIVILLFGYSYFMSAAVALLFFVHYILHNAHVPSIKGLNIGIVVLLFGAGAFFLADVFVKNNSGVLALPQIIESGTVLEFSLTEVAFFCTIFLLSLQLGTLIKQYQWLSNYHFRFHVIQYWSKLLLIVLVLWLVVHKLGLYNLFAKTFIGGVAVAIDFIMIQFAICAIVLYAFLYTENSKIGRGLNFLIEQYGKHWNWIILGLGLIIFFVSRQM